MGLCESKEEKLPELVIAKIPAIKPDTPHLGTNGRQFQFLIKDKNLG